MATANESDNINNSTIKKYPLAPIPGQTVKDITPPSLSTSSRLSEDKLPNNDIFSKDLDNKTSKFIDSKIYLFKEHLFRYGRMICPEIDIVNNENNEIFDYPIVLLQDLHKELQIHFDSDHLFKIIKDAYPKVLLAEKATEQVVLPLQIILGIMLGVYHDKVGRKNYVNNLMKIKHLSVATCYNYLNAAKMIDIIDDERIFAIGLVPLYQLYSMYKKGKIDNEIGLSEALIKVFCNITSSSINLSDDEFILAIKYVIFTYRLDQLDIDDMLLLEIFKGKYDWKKSDFTFICSHAYTKDTNNKKILHDRDFFNKYMKALIKSDFNGRLARETFKIPLPASGSNNIIQTTLIPNNMTNPLTIKSSVSHLLETLDYYSNNSKQLSKQEINELKIIREKLNKMNL